MNENLTGKQRKKASLSCVGAAKATPCAPTVTILLAPVCAHPAAFAHLVETNSLSYHHSTPKGPGQRAGSRLTIPMRGLLRADWLLERAVCHRQWQPAAAMEAPRMVEAVGDFSLSLDHRQRLGFKQPVQPQEKAVMRP